MEKFKNNLGPDFIPKPMDYNMEHKSYFTNGKTSESVIEGVVKKTFDFNAVGNPESDFPSFEVVCYTPSKESLLKEPIVFIQGFMSTPNDYEETLATIAKKEDRRVIGWNDIKGLPVGTDIRYEHTGEFTVGEEKREYTKLNENEVPNIQLSKVLAFNELLDQLDITHADVVAHSEGCIHTLLLENLTHRFRSIVLVSPAGITNNTSIISLGLAGIKDGFLRKIWDGKYGTPKEYLATGYKQKGAFIDRLIHTFESLQGMTRGDVVHKLMENIAFNQIENDNEEPHVTIIGAEQDNLFPISDLKDAMTQAAFVDTTDFIEMPETDHPGSILNAKTAVGYITPHLTK